MSSTRKYVRRARLRFQAEGEIAQDIEILRPGLKVAELVAGLNDGTYLTTAQEGGDIVVNEPGFAVVGRVQAVFNDMAYTNFEVVTKQRK